MSKRNIHIGKLEIRLPRSASGSARQVATGLGPEILRGLAEITRTRHGTMRIAEISVGRIPLAGDTKPQSLQRQIAGRVAETVKKQVG